METSPSNPGKGFESQEEASWCREKSPEFTSPLCYPGQLACPRSGFPSLLGGDLLLAKSLTVTGDIASPACAWHIVRTHYTVVIVVLFLQKTELYLGKSLG